MWRISLRSEVWIFPTRAYGAGSSSLVRRLLETCATRDPFPTAYWHLDEMVIVIRGQRYWLWRAVDNEGEVLDFLVQSKRNAQAALKLIGPEFIGCDPGGWPALFLQQLAHPGRRLTIPFTSNVIYAIDSHSNDFEKTQSLLGPAIPGTGARSCAAAASLRPAVRVTQQDGSQ